MTGILLIDKGPDWTSHDAVAKLRGLLGEKRIGHAGTLDPMATGLLIVFVGRATRAARFAEAEDKTYIADLRLGETTDTQDTTGNVLARCPVEVTRQQLEAAAARFVGEIEQIPPMYSAVKVEGKRLYKLARQGVEVEREPRRVTIRSIEIVDELPDGYRMQISCTKGTYIRTLCHDLGQALGCGGTMSGLRRVATGDFSVEDALTLEAVEAAEDREGLLLPVDTLFTRYPAVKLGRAAEWQVRNGLHPRLWSGEPGRCRVYSDASGEFLALGEIRPSKGDGVVLQIVKSFYQPPPENPTGGAGE